MCPANIVRLLYIDRGEKSENEFVFDWLSESKAEIEDRFGGQLEWDRDPKKVCIIKTRSPGDVFDRDQWETVIAFMTDAMCRLESAIKAPLRQVGEQVKNRATVA